jgi:hypothetical protein
MSEREEVDPEEHPEQAAALQAGAGEEEQPQDETENEELDTEQHSDAPGPFGTG